MIDKTRIQTLEEQLTQTRALLSNTVDTLQEERRMAAATKNRVTGGYYMMSRAAEKNLRDLQRENSTASLVFSVIMVCCRSFAGGKSNERKYPSRVPQD